jgi:hypothetical protein
LRSLAKAEQLTAEAKALMPEQGDAEDGESAPER